MLSPFREEIAKAAARHGLDPWLVEAVVQQESSGKADAFRFEPGYYERYIKKNPKWKGWEPRRVASSYGLMQVMYPTAVEHGFDQDPEALFLIPVNLEIGCRVLKRLIERFSGDVKTALSAYNGGPAGISRPVPRQYAHIVFLRYETLRGSPDRPRDYLHRSA